MATTVNWKQNVHRLLICICVWWGHHFTRTVWMVIFLFRFSCCCNIFRCALSDAIKCSSYPTTTTGMPCKNNNYYKFIHRSSSSSCKAVRIHKRSSPIKFHFDILICNFVVKFNVCERLLKEWATEKPLRFMSLVLYIIISRVWLDGLAAAKINICGDRAFGQNNNCNLL